MSFLNHDCLEHIFQFLKPKDWVAFSQVCTSWKLAATSKEFYKLKYSYEDNAYDADIGKMSFKEFFEILKLITPKLKYAKIQRRRYWYWQIALGRFRYHIVVEKQQEDIMMNILATRAESITTLKIDSFSGATKKQWKHFFQVNPVTSFDFIYPREKDQELFFKNHISLLPNTLEQLGIEHDWDLPNDMDKTKLLQLLQKQPRINKLKLRSDYDAPRFIATELAKHVNNLTELSLIYRYGFDGETYDHSQIMSTIPNCNNLTKLRLEGFTLNDALCQKIAQNCQSLRCLMLLHNVVPETSLKTLMSLPNLEKLAIYPMKMIFTTEAKSMKHLVIHEIVDGNREQFDYDNLARALTLMPSLTSLTFHGDYFEMTEKAARSIKQTIHSRGQNIVLYSYRTMKFDPFSSTVRVKKAEIPCPNVSSNDFTISCWSPFFGIVETLTKV